MQISDLSRFLFVWLCSRQSIPLRPASGNVKSKWFNTQNSGGGTIQVQKCITSCLHGVSFGWESLVVHGAEELRWVQTAPLSQMASMLPRGPLHPLSVFYSALVQNELHCTFLLGFAHRVCGCLKEKRDTKFEHKKGQHTQIQCIRYSRWMNGKTCSCYFHPLH